MAKLKIPYGDNLPRTFRHEIAQWGYNPNSREGVVEYFREVLLVDENTPRAQNCINDTIASRRKQRLGGLEPVLAK